MTAYTLVERSGFGRFLSFPFCVSIRNKRMSALAINVVYASLVISGLLAVACLIDLVTDSPFGGQTTYDIMFLLGAAITGYLGFDCIRDSK